MINTNLKFWRRELSLTQAQLADKLGIKRSLVGAYEEGRAEPRLATLVNMATLQYPARLVGYHRLYEA